MKPQSFIRTNVQDNSILTTMVLEFANHTWQSATISWAVFIGTGAAISTYYWVSGRPKRSANDNGKDGVASRSRLDGRTRREGKKSSDEASKSKKVNKDKIKNVKQETPSSLPGGSKAEDKSKNVVTKDEAEDRDQIDKEWAHNLMKARAGTKLTSTKTSEKRAKTFAPSAAIETPETSSISGVEADDDLSSTSSPPHNNGFKAPSGKVVSDMIESKGDGPSSLRIVADAEKPKAVQENGWEIAGGGNKSKVNSDSKKEAGEESKKQRQNRQKADEAKAMREEGEQKRLALLENQRRTAREARGEPAKNGVSTAPAVSSWTNGKPNGTAAGSRVNTMAHANSPAPLLDTFNEFDRSPQAMSPVSHSTANSWEHNLPDEEEQLRRIQENDDSLWSTAVDKKKVRKAQRQERAAAAAIKAASVSGSDKENVDEDLRFELSEEVRNGPQPQDSDWAVV